MRFIVASLLALAVLPCSAQIHVDVDAIGANDGSSWTDAYTDLGNAIYASKPLDQIWIAEGTYHPGNGTQIRDTFFQFPHDLELLGGFNGTETSDDQRDHDAHPVILSADYNGDDIDGDFETNKSDNALHVMFLPADISNSTVIDGVTIAYGYAEGETSTGNRRRGGGILTYGNPVIRNCTFTQNYGWFGGGLYPRGASNQETIIANCTFHDNFAGFGAGLYINQPLINLKSCRFEDNTSEMSGGAMYNSVGGGLVSDCVFLDNETEQGRGGAIYHRSNSTVYGNCIFESNIAFSYSGGGIYITSFDDEAVSEPVLMDCYFRECIANWGGAMSVLNAGSNVMIINTIMSKNIASVYGGAVNVGHEATLNLVNCTLDENSASEGGALSIQNDSTSIVVNQCKILNNRAENGGGINVRSDNDIGAINPFLKIENSIMEGNEGTEQGGGLNLLNGDLQMRSCVVSNCSNFSATGAGGAMSINGFAGINSTAEIINSTFHGNSAFSNKGGCIGHFTDSTGTSELRLQNNIFHKTEGNNYTIEAGEPLLVSLGGNSNDDPSLFELLEAENDSHFEDPLFVDADAGEFHLSPGSPCIDTGVDAGAPSTDIEGMVRMFGVDKGAYEYDENFSSILSLEDRMKLDIYPNPSSDLIHLSLDNDWDGDVLMEIKDIKGVNVITDAYPKFTDQLEVKVNISAFDNGIYLVTFRQGADRVTRTLVKQ